MSYVFCNKCGHRNPPQSAFCSACGSVLDHLEDRTIVLSKVDPLQDGLGDADNIKVDLDDIATGEAILVVRDGEDEGQYFSLRSGVTTIGRSDDAGITLDDITVSRQHSEIHLNDGRYIVKDVGSLNGTYVNQRRIDVAELSQGDELQVGKFRFIFFENGEGRP